MCRTVRRLTQLAGRSEGQTMSEYAVVLGVITSSAVVLFPELGSRVETLVRAVAALLP